MAQETGLVWFNLADMPEVILVRVMSYLELTDRYSLMLTCHRMADIFRHPSLWRHLAVKLSGNYDSRPQELERCARLVAAVGSYCQQLEFHFTGYYRKIDDDVKQVIHDLSAKCRLEGLVLSVRYSDTKQFPSSQFVGYPLKNDIDVLCSIVSQCHRLTSFSLRSWPVFGHSGPSYNEILEALCANDKLLSLEKLHLFWPDRSETSWAAVCTNQTKEYGLKVVGHFTKLTHLSLMSNVLGQDLVRLLATPGRCQLQNLRVMVIFSLHKAGMSVPRIANDAWARLTSFCPDLEVEIVFSSRVPSEEMFALLQPSIPLSVLHFMKYSRCGADDLDRVVDMYHTTLAKLVDYTDSDNSNQLVKLATQCPKLHTLVYNGKVNSTTVLELAKIRSKKWYRFEIRDSNFTDFISQEEDENLVIKKNAQGEYYSVDLHRWADSDESLERKAAGMNDLIKQVTQALGYRWSPSCMK